MRAVLNSLSRNRYLKIYIVLTVTCIAIASSVSIFNNPVFVSVENIINMLYQMTYTAIIALAVNAVVIAKGTDLSTGANVAVTGMIGALALQFGIPAPAAILFMLLTGALIGVVNGLLVAYLGVNPFIATYSMMAFARGLTMSISKASVIRVNDPAVLWLGTKSFGPVPVVIFVMLILVGVWWVIMNRTLLGRYIYAVGGNADAARASGINARAVKLLTFVLVGISCGLVGMLFIGRVSSAQPLAGVGYEFDILISVFIGGALFTGGSGRVGGAVFGTSLVIVIRTALTFTGISQHLIYMFTGGMFLFAVAVYQTGIMLNIKKFCLQVIFDVKSLLGKGACDKDDSEYKAARTLSIDGITKDFDGFVALNDIHASITSGQIIGLVGENGAGKSTLVSILGAVYEPTKGKLYLDGEELKFISPQDAYACGISVIHQHYSLIPELSIAQNLFFNQEPRRMGFINRAEMNRQAKKMLADYNLDLPVNTKAYKLTVGQAQLVEVVKAALSNPWLVIMDEPTSSLSKTESDKLYELVELLAKKNVAIVYITHKLKEVFKLCTHALVLRDGNLVGRVDNMKELSEKQLVNMMVGRELDNIFPYTPTQLGEVVLQADHISDGGIVKDVSFDVHSGEIVVLAGLMGAGRTEIIECLCGLKPLLKGSVQINGKKVKPQSKEWKMHNVAFVPEDRHKEGIIPQMSLKHNLSLIWNRFNTKSGFIKLKKETEIVEKTITRMSIKPPDPNKTTIFLSGGNQQKVVVGKWVMMEPDILLLDDPTRGIDVGAKAEIHQIIAGYKKKGAAIILISSELTEVLNVADRILVMHNGRIVRELMHGTTEEEVMHYAFGLHENKSEKVG